MAVGRYGSKRCEPALVVPLHALIIVSVRLNKIAVSSIVSWSYYTIVETLDSAVTYPAKVI